MTVDVLLMPIFAFAQYVDLVHVLALNLIGWVFKGCMQHHEKLQNWTDIIPGVLSGLGILFAYVDPVACARHPVVQGLANAGLAWLIHQGIKRAPTAVKDYAGDKANTVTQKIKTLGRKDG